MKDDLARHRIAIRIRLELGRERDPALFAPMRETDRVLLDPEIDAVARSKPGIGTSGRSYDALKRDEKRKQGKNIRNP